MKFDYYQQFIHKSRYARWIEHEKRREDHPETIDRYINNVVEPVLRGTSFESYLNELRQRILDLEVMPSMRALMTAGDPLNRDNTCGYNCSYLPCESIEGFSEAMFILICGCGVGYSVERKYTDKLPTIPDRLVKVDETIIVEDSKEGWSDALKKLLIYLYAGSIPNWDTSKVRKKGSRLKTFGGRASGPQPLVDLFNYIVFKFENNLGDRLTTLDVSDIMCKIGEVVVVGGVRRSAMIALCDFNDDRMRYAKTGNWWENAPERRLANISAVYRKKPDSTSFTREWLALMESGSGERGIFNREASTNKCLEIGRAITYEGSDEVILFGTNPCSEIILRPYQFCNLTEVVIREDDKFETLELKVIAATILGTVQSTYTYFPYLRDVWRRNTEEERLLGVSLTGVMDNDLYSSLDSSGELQSLRDTCVEVNTKLSEILGINFSAAITCNKPSGTVSQYVDSSSGINPRYSPYYIRRVIGSNQDPLTQFLKTTGVPYEDSVYKPGDESVFSFPVKSPEGSRCTKDVSAIEQLEIWLNYQKNWCEHKPSITIQVKEDEWIKVANWVYDNFDEVSGIAFLPYSEHRYAQAPYEEITKEQYKELLAAMPDSIDWKKLSEFEVEDSTKSSQTMACVSGHCELVDI